MPQFEIDLDVVARICLMLDLGPVCPSALTIDHIHRRSLQSSSFADSTFRSFRASRPLRALLCH